MLVGRTSRELEASGQLALTRKKVGNVERKMITLESMQNYFRTLRSALNASESLSMTTQGLDSQENAKEMTAFVPGLPKHKVQMFYNVKGGTGKRRTAVAQPTTRRRCRAPRQMGQ